MFVAGEAQQHLDVANHTISSLQARNQELEAQRQQMQQQIAMLQASVQTMVEQQKQQVDMSHTHAANIAQAAQGPNQNGADVSEALKALAASMGETMKELREIVSPKGSPKRSKGIRSAKGQEVSPPARSAAPKVYPKHQKKPKATQQAASSSSTAPASLFGMHYELQSDQPPSHGPKIWMQCRN